MKNPTRWEDLLQFVAFALLLLLANLWAADYFFRTDLTQDKRYTIAPSTKQLLNSLDDEVYVEVYLDGNLNPGFKRLQKAIEETLEEFGIYSDGRLRYRFVDPDQAATAEARNAFYKQLVDKGIQPTNLFENVEGKRAQKVIFPGAMLAYRNRQTPVMLLKGNRAASPQEQLNQSVEGVEYELATALKKLVQQNKPRIALITGHDELEGDALADLAASMDEFYVTERVNLSETGLEGFAAALVAQPKKPFAETEKFKLDQFLMNGGKALFFVDMAQMNIDSIARGGAYAFGYNLNLDDMLFRYGARPNLDLVQDIQMGDLLVNVGQFGSAPNLQPVPWPYYVVANRFAEHPTTRNLNAVYTRFVGSIDTVKGLPQVRKTPLLMSNQYSRVRRLPTMVSLDELKQEEDPSTFNRSGIPLAYLLEGRFTSLFKNRFVPEGLPQQPIKNESVPTKILVCADGDILRNDLDRRSGQPLPLGFDALSRQQFANKEWVLNLLAYLTDEQGVINTRLKQVALRPLDKVRVQQERLQWQAANMLLPLLALGAAGGLYWYVRRRRYAS